MGILGKDAANLVDSNLTAISGATGSIVPMTEPFLHPKVGTDKKIPTAHFLPLQLGSCKTSIPPADGNHRPTETANDVPPEDLNIRNISPPSSTKCPWWFLS